MSLEKPRVLVVDDEQATRNFLRQALPDWGFEVVMAESGEEGMARYREEACDLVLVDLAMPEVDGIEVVRQLRELDPEATAIVMTGYSSIESAVQAMKAGAADYLTKPFELDHLEIVLTKHLEHRRQKEKLHLLEEQVVKHGSFEGLTGVSQPMQRVYTLIRQLAENSATVLLQGETGTGKERVARAIHNRSHRRGKGFIAINCGALPETILESELFGHEQGAFTGALRRKHGLIEQADGGTLFLDEIEEMSPALQVKMLRTLQEREVTRLGGDQVIPVDFRLIAATNTDLRQLMERGSFRADLFYRLSVVVVDLPPLRARRGDIPLLTHHFLTVFAEKNGKPVREITPEAVMLLKAYSWPGNVRELQNAIEQAVLLGKGELIGAKDLPEYITSSAYQEGAVLEDGEDFYDAPLRTARERFERQYLEKALSRAGGVVAEAARRAGIQRQHFYKKMKQYGISQE
jgi:DNA-binding NtrC family response regulator